MVSSKAEKEFTVTNELGLHFRAAAMLVRTLADFTAEVTIANGDTVADGRSVLDLMTLAASRGTTLRVSAVGVDAENTVEAVGALIARNFAE
jgi:phosphoenolpyruvate---glycerone phosphotransferase subunit DhaM